MSTKKHLHTSEKTPFCPRSQAQLHFKLLSPYNQCRLHSVPPLRQWAVQGRDCSFSLLLLPSQFFPLLQCGFSADCSLFGCICSGMEHLLLFWPWHCLCFSLFFCSLPLIFCPFLNMFSQRHHQLHWLAKLWPAMDLVANTAGISPWPPSTKATPTAPTLPKPFTYTQHICTRELKWRFMLEIPVAHLQLCVSSEDQNLRTAEA